MVSEAKRTLKQRAFHGMREYLIISLYLFVVFSLFATYRAVILAEHQIELVPQGLAVINALALAKSYSLARSYILPTSSGTPRSFIRPY